MYRKTAEAKSQWQLLPHPSKVNPSSVLNNQYWSKTAMLLVVNFFHKEFIMNYQNFLKGGYHA